MVKSIIHMKKWALLLYKKTLKILHNLAFLFFFFFFFKAHFCLNFFMGAWRKKKNICSFKYRLILAFFFFFGYLNNKNTIFSEISKYNNLVLKICCENAMNITFLFLVRVTSSIITKQISTHMKCIYFIHVWYSFQGNQMFKRGRISTSI